MQLTHRPSKVLIAGNSGSGKSTFATCFLLAAPHRFKFLFDPEGEFALRNGLTATRTSDGLLRAIDTGWVIFDPDEGEFPDLAEAFDYFCDWVFQIAEVLPGEKLFFTDELQSLVETWELPFGLKQILERGRRRGMDTLLVTQQPNVIHNRVRNQVTEVVAFCQVDDNAVKFLESLGFDGNEVRCLGAGEWRSLQIRTRRFQAGRVDFAGGGVQILGTTETRVLGQRGDKFTGQIVPPRQIPLSSPPVGVPSPGQKSVPD